MSFDSGFESWLTTTAPQIPLRGALAILKLTAEGASIPFITRYRKEATGNLDEVAIRQVLDAKETFDRITRKKAQALHDIEAAGKLTPELRALVEQATDEDRLDDLHAPFRRKKQTKAEIARLAGLEPLADWLLVGGGAASVSKQVLEAKAAEFIRPDAKVTDADVALEGAKHIVVERLSEDPDLRAKARERFRAHGKFVTRKGEQAKETSKYELYFEFSEKFQSLVDPRLSHRYHAMRRGWMEDELKLAVEGPDDELQAAVEQVALRGLTADPARDSACAAILRDCAKTAWKQYLRPSLETELHRDLKAAADESAAGIFASNLKKLLLAAPLGAKNVVGIDPGIRTGCKLAIVDASGKHLIHTVLDLQTETGKKEAENVVGELVSKLKIEAFAIGNGTYGRETEQFIRATVKKVAESGAEPPLPAPPPVVLVSEAGASVFSVSEDARKEFPELDATVRSAISIARRLQDPLAELIRVDPKSVGVGQYQHDVAESLMKKKLDAVVEDCVNSVGIDVNTASEKLLSYVSGIGPSIAKAIVATRQSLGRFSSREDLKKVPRLQGKAFELAAGFLRIRGGPQVLDTTAVHPERYAALENAAKKLGAAISDLIGSGAARLRELPELAAEVGELTLNDIVEELARPGRDPRGDFAPFAFREDFRALEDVKEGMTCPGIVTNVTHFGAFIDIGVHQDGLAHLSELSDRFVQDPREVVSPGDTVSVRILGVNLQKKQISLSLKKQASSSVAERGSRSAAKQRKPRQEPGNRSEQNKQHQHQHRNRDNRMSGGAQAARVARGPSARDGTVPTGPRRPPPPPPPKPKVFKPDPNSPFAKLMEIRSTLKPKA